MAEVRFLGVRIPELDLVDDEAERRGITRSSAIVDAILGWLEAPHDADEHSAE